MHFEPEEVTDAGGNGDEGHVDKKIHGQLGQDDIPGRSEYRDWETDLIS